MSPRKTESMDNYISRALFNDIRLQQRILECYGCSLMLNSISSCVVVVNSCYQIVFCNDSFLKAIGSTAIDATAGARLGEALMCVHAKETLYGCGTAEHCAHCCAFLAIRLGLEGQKNTQDCTIARNVNGIEVSDFRINAEQRILNNTKFIVLTIHDFGHEKRRRFLEHVFFHDVLNTAGGIRNILGFICDDVYLELKGMAVMAQGLATKLINEIVLQKHLLAAETNNLTLNIAHLQSWSILRATLESWLFTPESEQKRIVIAPDTINAVILCDYALLHRVLDNMLKNALEATPSGGQVTLGCRLEQEECVFWVKNDGVIPKNIQLNIFTRGCSTKGQGRGLGTYSCRLLTERYLGGRVDFSSSIAGGTVFYVRLPVSPREIPASHSSLPRTE